MCLFYLANAFGSTVVTWGEFNPNLNPPPERTNIVAIASGEQSMVALTDDGKVAAWGELVGQTRPNQIDSLPAISNVIAIASGAYHGLALLSNGIVIGWGNNQFHQIEVPAGLSNVSGIACGLLHSLAMTSDGRVVAWGRNDENELNVPSTLTNAVAIAAGEYHSLAVRQDGTVVAWGAGAVNGGPDWNGGQSIVPPGLSNVVAVAGGQLQSLALKRDGTVVAWGLNDVGQTNVPSSVTNAVAVASGAGHSVALRNDGSVVMWGWGAFGQTNIPPGLTNVAAVSATLSRTSALVADGSPVITVQPFSRIVPRGAMVVFQVMASGSPPVAYQWRANGTNLPGATNSILVLANVHSANAGPYTVVVNNARGTKLSASASLQVVEGPPIITQQPASQTVMIGSNATFTVAANGTPPITYQWQHGGTNLANQTNRNLSITNAQIGDRGPYRAILSNSIGTVTSSVAILTVFIPSLTVTYSGSGEVTKSPDKPLYNPGEAVTITAIAGHWYTFTAWTDGNTNNPRIITIGTSNFYWAVFFPTTALETLKFNYVSRTAPAGMPAIFVDGSFIVTNVVSRLDAATVSMLTTFTNGSVLYTLDGSAPDFGASLYSGPFVLRRSAEMRAVAYDASFLNAWEADAVQVNIEPTFKVSVSTAGGGTVGVSPTGASYRSNTLVTLIATPAPGWTFLQWLDDAASLSATTSVRVVSRDLRAQALFGTTLATTVVGDGTVEVDPVSAFYPFGSMVRLTALPQPGQYFGAWGNAVASTNNPVLFTVTNANPAVSCAFGPLNAGQVALTLLVNGRGRATTSPRGNRFPTNQVVTLTATAEAAQEFLGWTGDAAAAATNLAVVLDQSKVITANFSKMPRLRDEGDRELLSKAGFRLTLNGEWGTRYWIEHSSNLTEWTPLTILTNTFGMVQFTDAAGTNQPSRFYRAVTAP